MLILTSSLNVFSICFFNLKTFLYTASKSFESTVLTIDKSFLFLDFVKKKRPDKNKRTLEITIFFKLMPVAASCRLSSL